MNPKENNKKNGGSRKSTYDVYVGHLPKNILEGKIERVFSKYGEIVDVLYRYGSGSYGYAIVKFKYQKDADRVLREVDKVFVCGYEMEVKNGKRKGGEEGNSQNIENGNGATSVVKTVTFAEPTVSILPMGNAYFMDSNLHDGKYAVFDHSEDGQNPVWFEIHCVNVENAVTFYGCLKCRYDEFRNLSVKLNSICPNYTRLLRKPALKKVYGALYLNDREWYRCSVIHCTVPSKPGLCIVQYIDYGNIAEVSYADMVNLPEPLQNLAPFAVKCVFSNLMCNLKSNISISYLHNLVGKRMSVYALSSWGVEYKILKCTCEGIDVVAELVRQGCVIYRSQISAKCPPLPNKLDKILNSKPQENHKCKKSNDSKANKRVGDACNGVKRHSYEVNNNEGVSNHVMNCKNSSFDETQDFIPKKIIKRGMGISDVVAPPALEATKNVNDLLKVDCVISNLNIVKNIRSLVALHTDDDLINNAVNFLKNESNVTERSDLNKLVENAYQKYKDTLKDLKECSNLEQLVDLKNRRNNQRIELLNELKQFLESFDYSLLEKKEKIQEIITDLESNSNAWMNIYLSRPPRTVEDLLSEYNKEKEVKKSVIEKARENTNEKQKKFLNFLDDLKKEFSLNMVDGSTETSHFDSTGRKKGSWALKFEETLTELGIALEEESSTSTMVKDRSHVSVIKCILEKLDVPKEKIDAECEIYKKYKKLFDDLNDTSDMSPVIDELHTLQKNIQAISSNYACNGVTEKPTDKLFELHSALLQEDVLLEKIAKASVFHFPEIILEHPELKLYEYQENFYLLKNSWDKSFFPLFLKCKRIESSYMSKLVEEPVVIKEFNIACDSEKKAFVKRAVTWNEIKSKSLVKIKALFNDKERKVLYAVIPPVWETLYDSPLTSPVNYKLAADILQQILVGLCDIHSRGIAHGAIHPLAILHRSGEILLDFNYDRKYLQNKLCLKGINFQVPSGEDLYKSADMYGFGCLVLWILFPNLSFSSTDEGVPNINAFQSIIQEVLSVKGFASLSALLSINQDLRPSSRVLLSNDFLKDLRIVSEAMS